MNHTVAEFTRAKRRRRLLTEHGAKLAESNKDYLFKPKIWGSNGY